MAYIIVVQPLVLSGRMFGFETGMDFGAVMTATCVAAAVATAIMAFYARYPIALAPGMGENFFLVFSVFPAAMAAGFSNSWQVGLGVIFVSGVLFFVISLAGVQERIMDGISPSMKNAMAVGIGVFIAFIGLQNAGLIVTSASIVSTGQGALLSPGTLVKLNPHFASIDMILFFLGLFLTSVLHVRRVPGSILLGILGTAALSVILKVVMIIAPEFLVQSHMISGSRLETQFTLAPGVISMPPPVAPTFFKMDIISAISGSMIPFIIIFLFMDVFDTIGTLIGVSEQAGFIKDNKIPRANRVLLSDAVGTVAGACLGTSTVTSFVESIAGVEQGGKTGLTGLTIAALFLLALFFSPIVLMIGSYATITAPALVVVGAMMIQNVTKIEWLDYSESLPAFLMIIGIPLSYSIADGLALGFISYPVIKLFSGKGKQVGWVMYLICVILLIYFIVFRAKMG
jgi:AGZA family xanthine/uracil permease-like MFS transporter